MIAFVRDPLGAAFAAVVVAVALFGAVFFWRSTHGPSETRYDPACITALVDRGVGFAEAAVRCSR